MGTVVLGGGALRVGDSVFETFADGKVELRDRMGGETAEIDYDGAVDAVLKLVK